MRRQQALLTPDKVSHRPGGIVVLCDYTAKAILEKACAVAVVMGR